MKEAVIVSTARTPIGKAYRGAFNNTDSPTLGGHVLAEAVLRTGIDPGEVQDVVMGCALPQGSSGMNIGRLAALAAVGRLGAVLLSLGAHAGQDPAGGDAGPGLRRLVRAPGRMRCRLSLV